MRRGAVALVLSSGPPAGRFTDRVLVSADGTAWRDVTPPVARRLGVEATTSDVESVDFIDPRNGWVATFDQRLENVSVWHTTDGGGSWTLGRDVAEHGFSAGDATQVAAAGPDAAYVFTQQPNGPDEHLLATDDGGQTFQTRLSPAGGLAQQTWPFYGSLEFLSPTLGFSAGGAFGSSGLVTSADGGRHWGGAQPPIYDADSCPDVGSDSTSDCVFDLPTAGSAGLVTAADHIIGDQATVTVSGSVDAGKTWSAAGRVTVATDPTTDVSFHAPAIAFAGGDCWILSDRHDRLVSTVSADDGRDWNDVDSSQTGRAVELVAMSASEAAALVDVGPTAESPRLELLSTSDSGRTWHDLDPS